MAANGISTLSTKEARQIAKLELAQAKRKGRVITDGGALGTYGTWSDDGTDDDTKNYYRSNNTYDATSLPDTYNGNLPGADDNPNTGGLLAKRPWVAVGAITAPESISESIDGDTLVNLQIWYDGADTSTYVPNATDEGQITQWTDKSDFAHNANPNGGAAKPTYEDTNLQGGYGYLEFDGNDNLSINPFTAITSASAFTIFFVSKLNTTTGTQYFGSTNEGGLSVYSNGTNFVANVSGGTATGTTAVDTDWHIHTLVYDGDNTSLIYRLDKSTEATATPGATTQATANTYYIGARDPSTSNLTGYVGEVIMFNKALGATEYANVENYLSNKWNI
mgnify:CR=1 FL=1